MNFQKCLDFTLVQEGGYTCDPKDTGNYYAGVLYGTMSGITPADVADWLGWRKLDLLSKSYMQGLSKNTIYAIYLSKYWNASSGGSLPPGIDLIVFDFAVNCGVNRSGQCLQEAVGFTNNDIDGAIGPHTLRAVNAVNDRVSLIKVIAAEQFQYYKSLRQYDVYGKGWQARTKRRRDTALTMVEV